MYHEICMAILPPHKSGRDPQGLGRNCRKVGGTEPETAALYIFLS